MPAADASVREKRACKLRTAAGKAIYRRRKCTIEPVFGTIKEVLGFRQFSLRGLANVRGEWCLVCLAFNLRRMHVLTRHQAQTEVCAWQAHIAEPVDAQTERKPQLSGHFRPETWILCRG